MSEHEPKRRALSRRELLRSGAVLPLALAGPAALLGEPARPGDEAYRMRLAAADFQRGQHWAEQGANGDEEEIPRHAAAYSKGLPHDRLGEVNPEAYALLLRALRSGDPRDFEFIPRVGELKLTNPQAAFALNLIGPDPPAIPCPPAPRFSSAEQAAEMAEL
ncbi:MAG TPA: twin-arginine translocation pathway signal protein, partial [Thermoanaerobaculia bacterium]|nr:twin-arginine translocation pathway signal protein [Thermoanaerobaculia bacterium]